MMFSLIAKFLTSKVGAYVTAFIAITCAAALGWYFFKYHTLATVHEQLKAEATVLREEVRGYRVKVSQQEVTIDVFRLQVQNCHESFEQYQEEISKKDAIIKKAKVVPRTEVKGVVDEDTSSQLIDLYNSTQ